MAEIKLNRGLVALVDEEDLPRLSSRKWRALTMHKQERYTYAISSDSRSTPMARFITNAPAGMVVDHINGNRLDNRKANLRVCTHAQNMRNRALAGGRWKGLCKDRGRWRVVVVVDRKRHRIGTFDTQEEAARAYDAAALRLHGEFARLNFPA